VVRRRQNAAWPRSELGPGVQVQRGEVSTRRPGLGWIYVTALRRFTGRLLDGPGKRLRGSRHDRALGHAKVLGRQGQGGGQDLGAAPNRMIGQTTAESGH
jgi:hypothetical protein